VCPVCIRLCGESGVCADCAHPHANSALWPGKALGRRCSSRRVRASHSVCCRCARHNHGSASLVCAHRTAALSCDTSSRPRLCLPVTACSRPYSCRAAAALVHRKCGHEGGRSAQGPRPHCAAHHPPYATQRASGVSLQFQKRSPEQPSSRTPRGPPLRTRASVL